MFSTEYLNLGANCLLLCSTFLESKTLTNFCFIDENSARHPVFIYGSLKQGGGIGILKEAPDCCFQGPATTLWPIY